VSPADGAAYWLPLVFMAVMGLALLAYVVLDGYDLGVGVLLPFATDAQKDMMVASIGPFWDANETWLVLGIGVLLIAFPSAHGLVLTTLYLPVTLMLIGLILRGVAFDFRVKARAEHKARWNALFAFGSLLAAVTQGWMLGRHITGFAPGAAANAFALLIALVLPAAYALLGSGWLLMKTTAATADGLRLRAAAWGRRAFWALVLAITAISVTTPLVSPTVAGRWFTMPEMFLLAPIPLASAAALWAVHHALHRPRLIEGGYAWLPFAGTVLVFVLAFAGLAWSQYPWIVLDRIDVWQAAAHVSALKVSLIGVGITLPFIIFYTVYAYRVFHGPAEELSYG
jgi:cytochrome bd ubiquinol oxidase subunit II